MPKDVWVVLEVIDGTVFSPLLNGILYTLLIFR